MTVVGFVSGSEPGGQMSGDQVMRDYAAGLPVPEFAETPFVKPPPLSEARVAIVTSAALHRAGDRGFTQGDTSYRTFSADVRDLVMGHWSPNFDRSGFAQDLDVVYPIDRLVELEERGVIGSVAAVHMAFAGNQPDDVATIRLDSGPAAAEELKADSVDVVLLTPV